MYEVKEPATISEQLLFKSYAVADKYGLVYDRYIHKECAVDKAKELNILEGIFERYEDEVQLLQQSLRAWVNREALNAGIDVTVLEEHVGYGRNTL